MIGVLVWQIVQYNMTFGMTTGPSKDINARFGLIGAIIWGIGSMVFVSIMWRLIFPNNLLNDSKSNSEIKSTVSKNIKN